MNKEHFANIQKAQNDYIRRIDNLAAAQNKEAQTDYIFSDAVKRDRLEARRKAAQFAMSDGAREAKQKAAVEVEAMKQAFRAYIVKPTDPATLASLQALLSGGVDLTDREIQAYADMGNYTILRLLQPYSRGRVTVPDIDAFERDMGEILSHFDTLSAYSGANNELADFVTARPWGQSAAVNGAILKGSIPKFPGKLEEIASRWAIVGE